MVLYFFHFHFASRFICSTYLGLQHFHYSPRSPSGSLELRVNAILGGATPIQPYMAAPRSTNGLTWVGYNLNQGPLEWAKPKHLSDDALGSKLWPLGHQASRASVLQCSSAPALQCSSSTCEPANCEAFRFIVDQCAGQCGDFRRRRSLEEDEQLGRLM